MSGMRRRGDHEGTIYQRADGRWEARVTLGFGSRRSFYGATRQEVVQRGERNPAAPADLEGGHLPSAHELIQRLA